MTINRIAWMWEEALQALEQAERRHRQFYGLAGARSAQPIWEPPADVFESESELFICIALPGVRPESVTVQLVANGLIVGAERHLPEALSRLRVRRLEVPYGRFERQLELAGGRYALIERALVDGCLTLRLGKE